MATPHGDTTRPKMYAWVTHSAIGCKQLLVTAYQVSGTGQYAGTAWVPASRASQCEHLADLADCFFLSKWWVTLVERPSISQEQSAFPLE